MTSKKLNQSNQNTSTIAAISQTTGDGDSIESFLQTIDSSTSAVKGHMRMPDKFAEENFILFAISDLTDQGTYWTINISTEASSATSPFSGGEALVVSFVVTGDKGDDGKIVIEFFLPN